jgi:hypothetical protein
MEEEGAFRYPIRMPGVLAMYLNNQNNFYVTPEFPANMMDRPRDGRIADGCVNWGTTYFQDFDAYGAIKAKLGIPVSYLVRYSDDPEIGMEIMAGYSHPIGLGLEITSNILFYPKAAYDSTEFLLSYKWKDFAAQVDIELGKALYLRKENMALAISPEVVYHLWNCDFKAGVEIAGITSHWARTVRFSPHMGISWNF